MLQIATPARLRAAWLALCVVGLALPPAAQATPAPPAAPADMADILRQGQETRARTIAARAQFAARMAPEIAAIVRANPAALRGPRDADALVDVFWLLRSAPDLQRHWVATLSAPAAGTAEQRTRVREFFLQSSVVRQLAVFFIPQDAAAPVPKNLRVLAVRLLDLLHKENLPLASAREYAAPLAALIDKPDALPTAIAIIKDQRLHEAGRAAMLEHLATAPTGDRPDMKRLEGIIRLQHRYRQSSLSETGELILLPLEAAHPATLGAVRKGGVMPLAVYPVRAPQPTLAVTRRADLPPLAPATDGKEPPSLPTTRPGERLYVLTQDEGVPFFAGTPLDQFAPVGPKVAEYTTQPRALLARRLAPGGQDAPGGPRTAVIAAACGPEELAAHLTSLAVVHAERERSMYGPRPETDPAAPPHMRKDKGRRMPAPNAMPKDMPGARPRFTRQMDMGLVTALAPHADAQGLTRLMGPIRAIWTRNATDGSWTETRYTPKGKSPAGKLSVSPLLQLNPAALAAIVADREEAVIDQWARYALASGDARTPDEALQATRRQFADLRAKGFVSPLDMGGVVYLMRWHNNDPAMQERFSAILDDRSLSPQQRLAAMRAASGSRATGAPVHAP